MTARRQPNPGKDARAIAVELSTKQRETISYALMKQLEQDAEVLKEHTGTAIGNFSPGDVASEDARSWVNSLNETVACLDLVGWPHDLRGTDAPAEAKS
jgi:hypothetical protein